MQTKDAYNSWAETYDQVENKTRDLEGIVIRTVLNAMSVNRILEIGCGTGKNTSWLAEKCNHLEAIDFSEQMLAQARQKIHPENVHFRQGDITRPWNFGPADLITCSLVLEHIRDLDFIFQQASSTLGTGGQFYSCELHPYKQIQGSRARFESGGETKQLEYFVHQVSDFMQHAKTHGFVCDDLQEWFDSDDRNQTPRLISFLFTKK